MAADVNTNDKLGCSSVTSGDLFARIVRALLTVLILVGPVIEAGAQSRSFQMAIWAERDQAPGIDTDIPVFIAGEDQPPGRSILIRSNYYAPITPSEYQWSRIVAVLVDEPYEGWNFPGPCWSADHVNDVEVREQLVADRAAELKSISPLTRFWVNLARPQLDWMMGPQCSNTNLAPVDVNRSYIDVISVDIYNASFATTVKPYYDWLSTHRARPDQQMALVPGTHYRSGSGGYSAASQAAHLQGYFSYANTENQNCSLPFGSRGKTGMFDGCPVWIILGWLAYNHVENGVTFKGERDPSSWQIADAWRGELANPVKTDLAEELKRWQSLLTTVPNLLLNQE